MTPTTAHEMSEPTNTVVAGPAMRSISYPSAHFPGPPTVGLDVPETWRPIMPEAYLQFGPKVDLAVVGPEVTGGVRSSLVVSVNRTLATDAPADLLTKMAESFTGDADLQRASVLEPSQTPTDSGSDLHRCHVATYDDDEDGLPVRRMCCTIYVHGDHMAHVVSVIGTVSIGDRPGLDALAAMFDTLRITQHPGYITTRSETNG